MGDTVSIAVEHPPSFLSVGGASLDDAPPPIIGDSVDLMPRVAVGNRYMTGVDHRSDFAAAESFQVVPWNTAFSGQWFYDAHFVTYDVVGLRGRATSTPAEFPRLRKNSPVVSEIRAAGQDVVHWGFAYDYDTPGHEPWTSQGLLEFKRKVEAAAERQALITKWALYYTTAKGARFIYVLKDVVPVGPDSEAMHRCLLRAWAQQGIVLDPGCSDWTRLFRLPCVMRER